MKFPWRNLRDQIDMEDIAIYGAGGFGREIACLIKSINLIENQWRMIGFFDDGKIKDSSNSYGRILGGIKELNDWNEPLSIVMAIGSPKIVEQILARIDNCNIHFPNLISPDVLFFDKNSISLGKGNVIGYQSRISCNVHLGDFNLINNDLLIGHDSVIGSYNVFNPSVKISGEVIIGNTNFFGISSVVLQQKKIGNRTTIAANSVVVRDTEDESVYFGNPATKIKNLTS